MPKPQSHYTQKSTLLITPQMQEQIRLAAAKKRSRTKQKVSQADIVREAINNYLAQQEDIGATRAYYTKSLRERLEALERAAVRRESEMEARITNKLLEVAKALNRAIKEQPSIEPGEGLSALDTMYYALSYQMQTLTMLLGLLAEALHDLDEKGKVQCFRRMHSHSPTDFARVGQVAAASQYTEQMRLVEHFLNELLQTPTSEPKP